MEQNNTYNNKKISYFRLFFTKYTIWGVLLILVAVIIDLCNSRNVFWLNIIKNGISTFGTALLVGAIFDFSKNSEAFTIFISNILRNIVVSKDFLNIMSEEEKKEFVRTSIKTNKFTNRTMFINRLVL